MRARIIGLGLIGGSVGMALRRAAWRVSYFDPNVTLAEALRSGAVDEAGDIADAPDIALIATPVDVALDVMRVQDCLTMSLCSVMSPLRAAAGSLRFVAGHPMAGRSTRGLAAASADLFAGKRWFIDWDDPVAMQLIRDCGAEPVLVDAAQHDAAIALTSHIPQMLSTALAAYLDERDVEKFAGSGLATFLRLARSDASVWEATIAANRQNIQPHLEGVFRVLEQMLEGESDAFEKAQHFMGRI